MLYTPLPGHISEGAELVRTERVLAVGRAFLTVCGLAAIYMDPTEPRRLQAVTYAVLAAYAAYGVIVMMVVHRASQLTQWQIRGLHAADVLWTSVLTFVSEGPVSPFFLFFLFVVLAAAFRWAFRETFTTAVIVTVVFLAETAVAAIGPWRDLFGTSEGETNRILLRAAYLLITGALLSYFAQNDKRARAELSAIADVARQPPLEAGLGPAMRTLSERLLGIFSAEAIGVVVRDAESQRVLRWLVTPDARRTPASADDDPEVLLDSADAEAWLFDDHGAAWHATILTNELKTIRTSSPGNWPLAPGEVRVPPQLRLLAAPTTIVAANLGLANEWRGRIYVFGSTSGLGAEQSVHLLESIADRVTPAITNVFLARRLRHRASVDERARVARELHDGAIQALFGLDMKIEAVRRADPRSAAIDSTLLDVQTAVRHEVHALRDLMQALRPVEIDDGQQLPAVVSSMVERFRRDTGISARFVATGARFNLSPGAAIEIVRIIQEALVNVRKHSGGRNVLVRIEATASGGCQVTIEDDGAGFDFEGRLSAVELDRRRIGPAIIRERARIAKADLVIESTRGQGARLELNFAGSIP